MDKYYRVGQAADDNIIRRMCFACWISKATDTRSEYVIPLSHGNSGEENSPQYYVHTHIGCLFLHSSSKTIRAPPSPPGDVLWVVPFVSILFPGGC